MIIRILGEGQWQVPDEQLTNLNQLDGAVGKALEDENEVALKDTLSKLLAEVRAQGEKVPDDVLAESDLILPDADASIKQLQKWLADDTADEGLIPGR